MSNTSNDAKAKGTAPTKPTHLVLVWKDGSSRSFLMNAVTKEEVSRAVAESPFETKGVVAAVVIAPSGVALAADGQQFRFWVGMTATPGVVVYMSKKYAETGEFHV